MIAKIIKMECITNLHAGNGDVNYNLIDNEVEKDPVTGYPTINSSGVKGALREYFKKNANLAKYVDELFGKEGKGDVSSTPGKLKVLCADMVAMPARASMGDKAFYLVSTQEMLDKLTSNYQVFLGTELISTETTVKGRAVEGYALSTVKSVFGKELHLLCEQDFRELSLPVMARNHLENGISKNLWYEEVVPHESIFCFTVLAETEEVMENFTANIDQKVVQFGGNASIGYGLCKLSVLEE